MTYLRDFGSGMSAGLIWLSVGAATVAARAMLSVRSAERAAQLVLPEFELCSCSVPLVLWNVVLFLYDQVADIRPRYTGSVVKILTGNSPWNTHS